MSKVIRISDSIFSRLQKISTPLVDSPGSVIERILDYYEKSQPDNIAKRQDSEGGNYMAVSAETETGLYLAPANKENLEATIINPVPFSVANKYLNTNQASKLKLALTNTEEFRCWAMTKSSRPKFNSMNNGDYILFTLKGTGKFSYFGRVIYKVESLKLGQALWSIVPTLPWELIYFIDEIVHVDIDKERLIKALGYNDGYVVPGIVRVNSERIEQLAHKHGSILKFIRSITS